MKICFVTGNFTLPPFTADSAGVLIHNYAYWMTRKGHQVDVLAVRNPRSPANYNLIELHAPALPDQLREVICAAQAAMRLPRLLDKNKYSIIHFFGNLGAWLASKIVGPHFPPTLITTETPELGLGFDAFRNGWPRLRREFIGENWLQSIVASALTHRSVKSVSGIIVDSSIMRDTLIRLTRVSPSGVTVMPNGVDTSVFRPDLDTTSIRAKHGVRQDELVVLSPSRISPYKNQLALLKTLPLVVKGIPNVKYVFAGPIDTPSYHLKLLEFAKAGGLADRVVFTGLVENSLMPLYHNLADVMVLPSLTEGHPLTLVESMSCGRAIITSKIPQMREHMGSGDEYMLVDCNDVGALASALITLLSDSDLRRRMGEACRRAAVEYYDWSQIADRVLSLYQRMVWTAN